MIKIKRVAQKSPKALKKSPALSGGKKTHVLQFQNDRLSLEKKIESLSNERERVEREKILDDAIINHLGEGLIVIDRRNTITILNDRARAMLGYETQDDLIGTDYYQCLRIQDREGNRLAQEKDPVEHAFTQGKKTQIAFTEDYFIKRKDGSLFPVMLSAAPVFIKKEIIGVVLIVHDATKEKGIDEAKSDFISIASHQLRTPLTVSSLHTQMLLANHAGELNKEQREYIEEIAFYNKKMTELLNVFLAVTKIEMESYTIETEPVDLRKLMEEALHEHSVQIKNKGLTATFDYDEDLTPVETAPEFISVAFQNLISNAVKYTPDKGSLKITIRKEGGSALACVSDTGCGIPTDEHALVFTKLYRGRNAKRRDSDGTGLGLYITKSIVEKCGGKIWFESEENEGARFCISLPFKSKLPKKKP